MSFSKFGFLLLFLGLGTFLSGQVAEYSFCVQSDNYETFKAHVVFRGLDFGSSSAQQMVRNDLEAVLDGDFEISVFDDACPCSEGCPQVEVTSKDWGGNLADSEGKITNIWGSAVEITDAVVSEGKALMNNPGQFLMTRILGQDEK